MPPEPVPLPTLNEVRYRRVGVGVELAGEDAATLAHAAALARQHRAAVVLIHVVEGPGAALFGPASADRESEKDRQDMTRLVGSLRSQGFQAEGHLGYGTPAAELVRLAGEQRLDLLVLGSHGHRFLADLALGETVAPVLHRLTIPVLVIPPSGRG
ncbi:MAG: universal stress protein [Gemmataceae bacterium]